MRQAVGDCADRGADVHRSGKSFESMMASFMQEITEPDYARRLTRKIHCQPRAGSAENADRRIQFCAATLQVRARH